MNSARRYLRSISIALSLSACALLLRSWGSSDRALASTPSTTHTHAATVCERYVFAKVSDLIAGLTKLGYQGAVVDVDVEGTWYQNEVAQLNQEVDFKYHQGSKESDAWNSVFREYFSAPRLQGLANGDTVKETEREAREVIGRWCTKA
ncbi:MAG: hypothetical protein ACRDVC_00215 [Acidimicrobiales bacterium]